MKISLNGNDWRIMQLAPSEWVWRQVGSQNADLDNLRPAAPPWIPAVVPGDVQSDLADAGILPDFTVGYNSRACEWTSRRDWIYRKEFILPTDIAGKQTVLRFESVDYACHVFLNGMHLGDHEGTYTPFEFNVKDAILPGETNRLVVVVEHAPTDPAVQGQVGWTNRVRRWKPRFAYGWDWCTILVPLGIIGDVDLMVNERAAIQDVRVRTELHPGINQEPFGRAMLNFEYSMTGFENLNGKFVVRISNDSRILEKTFDCELTNGQNRGVFAVEMANPRLWQPNGNGLQPLYEARVQLLSEDGSVIDEQTLRFGIRQVRAVANDNAPENALPYVLEVNGRKTWLKGWNWAPISQLYGRLHEREYRNAIRMAKEANCNFLRVWGGGLLERELFYNLCDEAGIMVWQELFQSSSGINNEPASDAEYIEYVSDQARQVVPLRSNHPSLVAWCGGNELFTPDMVPIGNDHPTIAALKKAVSELDPDRIFLPTSPSGPVFAALVENVGRMHDVHGNWQYLGNPAHYAFFNTIDPLLHSEYGVEGSANLSSLRRVLKEDELWPPDHTNPAYVNRGAWWINRPTVEALFGPLDNIEDFVKASQWIHWEGLRYAAESSRRRKWRTSGSMPWQFNESWPNAACTNALDYYGHAKPAYWGMREAYAPISVTAAYDKIVWQPGEQFEARLWLNASAALNGKLSVRWSVVNALTGEPLAEPQIVEVDPVENGAIQFGAASVSLPAEPGIFALRLEYREGSNWVAGKTYLYSTFSESPFLPMLRAKRTAMHIEVVAEDKMRVSLPSNAAPLLGLTLVEEEDWSGPYLSEGYVVLLLPGETVTVATSGSGVVTASAWNASPVRTEIE